jgi:hypothetical protein
MMISTTFGALCLLFRHDTTTAYYGAKVKGLSRRLMVFLSHAGTPIYLIPRFVLLLAMGIDAGHMATIVIVNWQANRIAL